MSSYVPAWFLYMGPADLAVWQWLGIGALAVIGYFLGRACAWVVVALSTHAASRTSTTLDDQLLLRLRSPLRALATLGVARLGMPLLELHADAREVAREIMLASCGLVLLWGTLRAIDVLMAHLGRSRWLAQRPSSRPVLSLIGRTAKGIVLIIAVVELLGALGLPVASLLAGLGIGGIAIAFGAQKTVENLFGAIAIGVDQPLREGDFVKIESDVVGTVEAVGLRSTRIRTLDRTLVSLPNGKLADMRVETYAARDRCRFATTLGLEYGTTAEQLRQVLAGLERVLRAHPGIWPNDVIVRFAGLGESSLDIEIMAWFQTSDYGQFRTWRQEALLSFMDVVEAEKTSFAFPTRTVHLVRD
jgi:MscS family membrane protein